MSTLTILDSLLHSSIPRPCKRLDLNIIFIIILGNVFDLKENIKAYLDTVSFVCS